MREIDADPGDVILEPPYLIYYSSPLEGPVIEREAFHREIESIWARTAAMLSLIHI